MLFGVIFALIFIVISIAGLWKIYEKAGEPGWKCIIPFYGQFIEFRFCWKTSMFWIYLVLSLLCGVVYSIMDPSGTGDLANASFLLVIIYAVLGIVVIVLDFMLNLNLSRAFGHGTGFAIGLFFVPFVFILILGFGSSQYIGNQS